jgi:hypothetical protein
MKEPIRIDHTAPPLTGSRVAAIDADVQRLQRVRDAGLVWARFRDRLPTAAGPPAGWRLLQRGGDGAAYRLAAGGHMTVIESVAKEVDGRAWHHVSLARRDRDPTWRECIAVKEAFIGLDEEAYMVGPPAARYVNLGDHVLHWWHCLDVPEGAVLPDFSGVGPTTGTRTI